VTRVAARIAWGRTAAGVERSACCFGCVSSVAGLERRRPDPADPVAGASWELILGQAVPDLPEGAVPSPHLDPHLGVLLKLQRRGLLNKYPIDVDHCAVGDGAREDDEHGVVRALPHLVGGEGVASDVEAEGARNGGGSDRWQVGEGDTGEREVERDAVVGEDGHVVVDGCDEQGVGLVLYPREGAQLVDAPCVAAQAVHNADVLDVTRLFGAICREAERGGVRRGDIFVIVVSARAADEKENCEAGQEPCTEADQRLRHRDAV
jgi:hypothetical protein